MTPVWGVVVVEGIERNSILNRDREGSETERVMSCPRPLSFCSLGGFFQTNWSAFGQAAAKIVVSASCCLALFYMCCHGIEYE